MAGILVAGERGKAMIFTAKLSYLLFYGKTVETLESTKQKKILLDYKNRVIFSVYFIRCVDLHA